LAETKTLIAEKRKLTIGEKYELIFYNQQTNKRISDNTTILYKNDLVLVERVPI
jgi:hypothetical protein